jgi:membrane protein
MAAERTPGSLPPGPRERASFFVQLGKMTERLEPPLPKDAPLVRRFARGALRLAQGLLLHNAFDVAAGMAVHFFLSLVPLLVVLGFVLGRVVRSRGVEALMDPLLDTIPDVATPLVKSELERLAKGGGGALGLVGALGFLWLGAGGTHGLLNVFEIAFGAQRRPWWKKRALAMGWVVVMLSVLSGVTWAILAVDARIQQWGDAEVAALASAPPGSSSATAVTRPAPEPPPRRDFAHGAGGRPVKRRVARFLHGPTERASAITVLLAVSLCSVAAFFRFAVEHPPGVARRAWPGAFVAVFTWLVVTWAFGQYVSSLASYALFYGSLAAVAVLLIWFYLTSLALLVGAELNAQLEGLRDG